MVIGARTAAWSGKPLPYDAEVEWIESVSTEGPTNHQYIDLKIPPRYALPLHLTTEIMINMSYTEVGSTPCLIGGATKSTDYRNWILSFPLNAGFVVNCALKYNSISSLKVTPYVFHKMEVQYEQGVQKMYCDDVLFCSANNTMTLDSTMDGHTLKLGKAYWWDNNSVDISYLYPLRFKIRNFHITANGVERNLQSVRFTNENGVSEGAMYDRVSGQLFRNAGTGAFIIGPDKT